MKKSVENNTSPIFAMSTPIISSVNEGCDESPVDLFGPCCGDADGTIACQGVCTNNPETGPSTACTPLVLGFII